MRMTAKSKRILEAIPFDKWVKASDMEEKTGLSSHEIGAIISQDLSSKLVDRRHTRELNRGHYEYMRRIGDQGGK